MSPAAWITLLLLIAILAANVAYLVFAGLHKSQEAESGPKLHSSQTIERNTDFDLAYFDEKFLDIPQDMLGRAAGVLIRHMPPRLKEHIREEFQKYGPIEWIFRSPILSHHWEGVWIRNCLRKNDLDEMRLPDKNWDDYYIQITEFALGLRNRQATKIEKAA